MSDSRVALITGASSGIGEAAAIACMKAGIHVVGTSRKLANLAPLESATANLTGEFLPLAADVRSAAAMRQVVEETLERFSRLDYLIANAGVGHTGSLVEATDEEVDQLLRTNIDGVIHSARAAAPALRASGGGHIIIVSSVVAPMTLPYAALYAASKACVTSLARSLYYELHADQIHVSDFLLGRTETQFNANRLGKGRQLVRTNIPPMSAEEVGRVLLRALERRPRSFVARPFDRLLLLVNGLFPRFVARRAARIYRG